MDREVAIPPEEFFEFNYTGTKHEVKFLEVSILFGFQTNGEVFHILNYCILNGKFYIHKQKLFHENALDFYDYLWELKI